MGIAFIVSFELSGRHEKVMDRAKPITPGPALPILRQAPGFQALQFNGCCDFGFWIVDFGFPENKSFFEESELSLAINSQYSIDREVF